MKKIIVILFLLSMASVFAFGAAAPGPSAVSIVKDPYHDIRAYGAIGNGIADDTVAIQAALDAAIQETVLIPPGTYKTTATLTVSKGTTILGEGYNSIIKPVGCDGFSFDISTLISPIRISNFHIWGPDTSNTYKAFKVLGSANTADRVTGITFDNLYIAFWGTGMHFRSLWHSRIYACTFNRVWTGINFEGQNVKVSVDKCSITQGIQTGTGDSVGISVDSASDYDPGGNTEHRPEDISIDDTIIYGFDIGIDWVRVLYGKIIKCDIDSTTKIGIRYSSKDGGLAIRDCYIAITGTDALYGIEGIALASPSTNVALISHNHIVALNSPHADSIGILIRANQDNVTVEHNRMTGFQQSDINFSTNRKGAILHNKCHSTDPAVSIIVTGSDGWTKVFDNDTAKPITINSATLGTELESVSLDRFGTATSTSGTGEDDLRSTVIRANTLDKFRGIHIVASGLKTTGGGNKTIKLHFGDDAITVFPAANDTVAWILEAWITNDNATNLQQVIWQFNNNGTVTMGQTNAPNQDTTADVTVKLTGECANAGDTITQNFWLVERF